MGVDPELKRLLAAEVRAITEGWNQHVIASMLGLRQPQVSALRNGRVAGFSVGRLLRLMARHGYDIEVHLRATRRFSTPRVPPKVTVQRYDVHGRPVKAGGRAQSGERSDTSSDMIDE